MLLMKVAGAVVRGVSMMYATTVGRLEAMASVMMDPEADQVKISICPGVSTSIYLTRCQLIGQQLWSGAVWAKG